MAVKRIEIKRKKKNSKNPGDRHVTSTPPGGGGGGGGGNPTNPYTQPLVITATPTTVVPSPGTRIASVSGRAPNSTLTPLNSENVGIVDSIDTARVNMGTTLTGPDITKFGEPGRIPWTLQEDNNISVRTAEGEFFFLPAGVTYGEAWTPFKTDTFLYNAWLQESLAEGAVAEWENQGGSGSAYHAVQADVAKQPTKLAGTGGVEFAENSDENLLWAGDQERAYVVRTTLTVFRVDPTTGNEVGTTHIMRPQDDGTGGGYNRSSYLGYENLSERVITQWRDPNGNNEIGTDGLTPDYNTWAFVVHYHRDGQLFAKFNGNPPVFYGTYVHNPNRKSDPAVDSYFGWTGNAAAGNCTFAIDCRLEFSELSDEYIAKLERWAADRAGLTLPIGHKYRTTAPVVDEADYPLRVVNFNYPGWRQFQKKWEQRDISRAGLPFDTSEFTPFDTPVFYDDFRSKSIANGTGITPANFYTLGGLAANTIGGNASLVQATGTPDVYPYTTGEIGIECGRYSVGGRTGTFSTVDEQDDGITFKGGGWWRVRFKFVVDGTDGVAWYFPCPLWFYTNVRAKFPFSSNFEFDTFEFDSGQPNIKFMNGGTHHLHPSPMTGGLNGRHNSNQDPDPYNGTAVLRRKPYGNYMDVNINPSWQGPAIDFSDGSWHIMDFIHDEDTDECVLAVDELEIVRWWRTQFFDYRLHAVINNNLRTALANLTVDVDKSTLWIDSVSFRKKAAKLALVPSPFTARPTISGTPYVGQTLTATANLPSHITQYRCEWYHDDGYPITREKSNTLVLNSDDIGKQIRCKIVTTGYWEDEEAWSTLTAAVGSGTTAITTADIDFVAGTYTVNSVTHANFAALQAAVPQFSFVRNQTGSVLEFSTGTISPFVAANSLRLHPAYGLVYEASEALPNASDTYRPTGQSGGAFDWFSHTGPAGANTMHAFWESSATTTRRIATVNVGTTVFGQRSTMFMIVRGGQRNILRVEGMFTGSHRTYFTLSGAGTVTGISGGALPAGTSATITAIPGFLDHYFIQWSCTESAAGGTSNATISVSPALSNSDTGSSYAGDTSAPAIRLGLYQVRTNTTDEAIYLPWWGQGTRQADQLLLPLGGTPRDVTLTVVDPSDGTESAQVLSSVSGDYVIPAASLDQPIIKRIQIS